MKIEVSIGEAIDKLSILEIKIKNINDQYKKKEIQKEIDILNECYMYKNKYLIFYNLLIYVNQTIWDMTNIIKSISFKDSNFADISNQIFEFNQKRFRIKNWFNLITSSNINEQKSYLHTECKILINDITIFYEKIPEIYFLSLDYDNITIISNFNDEIIKLINIPTIIYNTNNMDNNMNDNNNIRIIVLENYCIDKNIRKIFD
jgi:hypothetical protein